ncbi:hypothetical protein N7533_002497 [Penicillium manginii]|jgi:hypothetical protein|uniref:uncharacterized protein n=1 Tax=Penicillium manginii TaxID=203109 RepID=UPI0025482063|nr:uncharacterized protein N7533_002497 [Penicillium manginii]KAJ5763816.1 hypothetical protein N7533_002497 [Penicillium manginii]
MSQHNPSAYDIHVAFCRARYGLASHWVILLSHPGSSLCTWYHVAGGPAQNRPYEFEVKETQRLNHPDFTEKIWISGIPADYASELEEIAETVPLQESQNWTIRVVRALEQGGMVSTGTSARLLKPYVGT